MEKDDQTEIPQWYLSDGAKQPSGPYAFSVLIDAIGKNLLTRDHYVWRPSWTSWRPASTVPGLFLPPENPQEEIGIGVSPERSTASLGENEKRRTEKTSTNYLIQHWRGQLELSISFWLNGVLVLGLLKVALFALTFIELHAVFFLCGFCLYLLAIVWSYVGIWRSAIKYEIEKDSLLWPTLAKLCIFVTVLSVLFRFAQLFRGFS